MYMRHVMLALLLASCGLVLWGCGSGGQYFAAKPEPWREQEERACLVSGHVREQPWLVARSALGASSNYCGAIKPFQMLAANGGQVAMKPPAMLRCNMIPAVERWVYYIARPAAQRIYGVPLAELKVAASYSCRPMNNVRGAKLSEHGHANAIDISAFTLADGRKITVKGGWWGDGRDRAFLRAVHEGACREFKTVLGPNHDRNHHDHFHLDLARHGRSGRESYCK